METTAGLTADEIRDIRQASIIAVACMMGMFAEAPDLPWATLKHIIDILDTATGKERWMFSGGVIERTDERGRIEISYHRDGENYMYVVDLIIRGETALVRHERRGRMYCAPVELGANMSFRDAAELFIDAVHGRHEHNLPNHR